MKCKKNKISTLNVMLNTVCNSYRHSDVTGLCHCNNITLMSFDSYFSCFGKKIISTNLYNYIEDSVLITKVYVV